MKRFTRLCYFSGEILPNKRLGKGGGRTSVGWLKTTSRNYWLVGGGTHI